MTKADPINITKTVMPASMNCNVAIPKVFLNWNITRYKGTNTKISPSTILNKLLIASAI